MLKDKDRNEYFQNIIEQVEQKWRNYLLNNEELKEFNCLHLLIGVDVTRNDENNEINIPDRIITYMARYLDSGITDDGEDYCIGFLKLPRFFFLIPLSGFSGVNLYNTDIYKDGGVYNINKARVEDGTWAHLILDRVKQFESALDNMSPTQRQKMIDIGIERWDDFKNKDLGDILNYQYNKRK
ncbi:MAG TPA: hypothetical protein VK167_03095 [Flavipsychrobacter sp.]|nr:hypothetical protein [Flavipsychrobacter sp.]